MVPGVAVLWALSFLVQDVGTGETLELIEPEEGREKVVAESVNEQGRLLKTTHEAKWIPSWSAKPSDSVFDKYLVLSTRLCTK